MTARSFEWAGDLMVVEAVLWGLERGLERARELRLVVDTGAAMTAVDPAVLEELGYTAREAIPRARILTLVGGHRGHLIRTRRFRALGAELAGLVVQARALAGAYGVDGVLGMDFLGGYNFTVRPGDQQILLEPVERAEPPLAA